MVINTTMIVLHVVIKIIYACFMDTDKYLYACIDVEFPVEFQLVGGNLF